MSSKFKSVAWQRSNIRSVLTLISARSQSLTYVQYNSSSCLTWVFWKAGIPTNVKFRKLVKAWKLFARTDFSTDHKENILLHSTKHKLKLVYDWWKVVNKGFSSCLFFLIRLGLYQLPLTSFVERRLPQSTCRLFCCRKFKPLLYENLFHHYHAVPRWKYWSDHMSFTFSV